MLNLPGAPKMSVSYDSELALVSILLDSEPTGTTAGWTLGLTIDDDGFYSLIGGPSIGDDWAAAEITSGWMTVLSDSTALACL